MKVYNHKINGLNIVIISDELMNKNYVSLIIKVGGKNTSYNDNNYKEGMAHFLEHTFFYKNDYDYFYNLGKISSDINAETAINYTKYYATSYTYKEITKGFIDMFNSFVLNEKYFDQEKCIILREIASYNDDPEFKIEKKIDKILFNKKEESKEILGEEFDIKHTKIEDLFNFYKDFYKNENSSLFIVTNDSIDDVLEFLNSLPIKKDEDSFNLILKKDDNVKHNICTTITVNYEILNRVYIVYEKLNIKDYIYKIIFNEFIKQFEIYLFSFSDAIKYIADFNYQFKDGNDFTNLIFTLSTKYSLEKAKDIFIHYIKAFLKNKISVDLIINSFKCRKISYDNNIFKKIAYKELSFIENIDFEYFFNNIDQNVNTAVSTFKEMFINDEKSIINVKKMYN